MTPTGYYAALIAKSFGWDRRNKCLTDASQEMGLLREAEYQLGLRVWEHAEHVDEISVEYWNLRKHMKELQEKNQLISNLDEELASLHTERSAILHEETPEEINIEAEKKRLMHELEDLSRERDFIVSRAKDIRRAHEGFLTKIEVLEREHADEQKIAEVKKNLDDIKDEFRSLKKTRQEIATFIINGDKKIDDLDHKMSDFRQEKRERAAVVFQKMGEINRQLSSIRSEYGVIQSQIRLLLSEMGRYISRYDKRDPACEVVAKKEKTLIEVMRLLRISISMNHKLADFK